MSFDPKKTYKLETLAGRIIEVNGTIAKRFAKLRPNQYRLVLSKGRTTPLTLNGGEAQETDFFEKERDELEKQKAELEKEKAKTFQDNKK